MFPPPSKELVQRFADDINALRGGDEGMIGLAVSGGPDSLALLLLAAGAFPDRIEAATVDHGLRPESGEEALLVSRLCTSLGVPHETLEVEVARSGASLQRRARDARYQGLGRWLRRRALPVLATAHHVDDQAETLMMRLLRGAGVAGLSGVRAVAPFPLPEIGALLVRPLLGWRREELHAIVAAAGITPADDSSNRDPRFDRVRVRQHLAHSAWIDPAPLARSAAALADANQALEWMTDQLAGERIRGQQGHFTFSPEGLPRELQRRLMLRVLAELSPDTELPRGGDVVRLLDRLREGATATLAGVKAVGGADWTFTAAPPRRDTG